MANSPGASTSVSDTAGAVASGLDVVCVISPCAQNADVTPRLYGQASAIYQQHGYNEGVEYSALHAKLVKKPIVFVGVPIATPGVVGRKNTTGNTGTSVVDVVAGGDGILGEHDGIVKVSKGGTIGTNQIFLSISLDGGTSYKTFRLGTASSLALPYVNATLTFDAGTLVAGDTIITWHGSAPRSDSSGWAAARAALAEKMYFFRTMLLMGDLQSDTEAASLLSEVNAYETENDRFTIARASVIDRLPRAEMAHTVARMTGAPSLTFAEVGGTGDTITRAAGSWIADGFAVGDYITVTGSVSNNVSGIIASLSATVITLNATDLAAEVAANCTVTASPGLAFAEVGGTGDTITRSRGSWIDDGFRVGDLVTVSGSGSNNFTATAGIASLTATVMTFGTTDLAAELVSSAAITITAGQTKAVWMAAIDTEFAPIDASKRISLGAARRRILNPFSGWNHRRSAAWAASLREYQNDLHYTTWRKDLGPLPFLHDTTGEEWDDRVDGGAASAARFTSFTTWSNGPVGPFISNDLTRESDGSLLCGTHNMVVTNLACTTVQLNTENVVGRSDFILNEDGTATSDSLKTVEIEVNTALELALLKNAKGQGPRASKAVWTAATDDLYNVVEPVMNGVLELQLKGTVFRVNTVVRVRSNGQ